MTVFKRLTCGLVLALSLLNCGSGGKKLTANADEHEGNCVYNGVEVSCDDPRLEDDDDDDWDDDEDCDEDEEDCDDDDCEEDDDDDDC